MVYLVVFSIAMKNVSFARLKIRVDHEDFDMAVTVDVGIIFSASFGVKLNNSLSRSPAKNGKQKQKRFHFSLANVRRLTLTTYTF